MLAKERRIFIGTVKSMLEAAGIALASDPKEIGARFYRRSES